MGRAIASSVVGAVWLLTSASPVESQPCPSGAAPTWAFAALPTQPVSNTKFGAASRTYFAHGSTLYAIRNLDEAPDQPAGSIAWVWSTPAPAATINNFPNPVPLKAGGEFIFLTTDNGRLYKIDASGGTTAGSTDTRRAACPADGVDATPSVVLYQYSDAVFRGSVNDDLVIVITRYECADHTNNRVIAYYASTLGIRWIFNSTGAASMDYGSEGCSIDYATNRLYWGTAQGLPGQKTLWAVNTIDGSPAWSTNAGAILNRPQLSPTTHRLYVATGTKVQAYETSTGAADWVIPYIADGGIAQNFFAEFRNGQQQLFFTSSAGTLHAIADLGSSAAQLWPPTNGGGHFVGMPVLAQDRLYVGRDDGRIQQLGANSGGLEAQAVVGPAGTLFDPGLDYSSPLAPAPDRLNVPAGGSVLRFCVPFGDGVAVDEPARVSLGGSLLPNAPNPFQDRTRIAYRLERAAGVELCIFDLAGHRIRTLMRADQPAGRYQVSWDGLDDGGRRAASGMYFCRLRLSEGADAGAVESRQILRLE